VILSSPSKWTWGFHFWRKFYRCCGSNSPVSPTAERGEGEHSWGDRRSRAWGLREVRNSHGLRNRQG
jgi:hypothetical protein